MRASRPELADYLDSVRQKLTEPLAQLRNDIEHKGWNMPGIQYRIHNQQIEIGEYMIGALSFTDYVNHVFNGAVRFVEDMTAYALKTLVAAPRVIIELPDVQRASGNPKRFALAFKGDYRTWHLTWATDVADFLWNGQ